MTPEFFYEVVKNVTFWGALTLPNGDVHIQGFICNSTVREEYPQQIIHTRPTEDKVTIKIYLVNCNEI